MNVKHLQTNKSFHKNKILINSNHTGGGGKFAPLLLFLRFPEKMFLATYNERLCQFLFWFGQKNFLKGKYRVHSLYFVKNPYMISCTDFRKSVHKIRTSVHKIRTSGFKSVHMLFKFYLFFTCHSCIWKVMSLEPYIFSQDIGWKKTVIWFSMKKRYEFCLNRV